MSSPWLILFSVYLEDILKANPQNERPTVLDPTGLSQILTPYAFSQSSGQSGRPQSTLQSGESIVLEPDVAHRLLEQNRKRIERLDPVVQDHIKKLQQQSNDGRTLLVEVRGDNTRDDSSLLDKLRPILYDPSVLDQMKPQLKASEAHTCQRCQR